MTYGVVTHGCVEGSSKGAVGVVNYSLLVVFVNWCAFCFCRRRECGSGILRHFSAVLYDDVARLVAVGFLGQVGTFRFVSQKRSLQQECRSRHEQGGGVSCNLMPFMSS